MLGIFWKITKVAQSFWAAFFPLQFCTFKLFFQQMVWATFGALFSPPHLLTLSTAD
jgi:hypothetical protein